MTSRFGDKGRSFTSGRSSSGPNPQGLIPHSAFTLGIHSGVRSESQPSLGGCQGCLAGQHFGTSTHTGNKKTTLSHGGQWESEARRLIALFAEDIFSRTPIEKSA